MKIFYNGYDMNGTVHMLVAKMDKAQELIHLDCAVDLPIEVVKKAEITKNVSKNLINWLMSKGAIATCQYCGSHHGEVVGDLKNYGTICPKCYEERTGWKWIPRKTH